MTLIETLVVLAIIAILMAILIPAVHYSRQSARRTACAGNLHQLGIALQEMWELQRGARPKPIPKGAIHGWAIEVLPFIEEQALADQLDGNPIVDPANPLPAARLRPPLMRCPSGFEGDSSIPTIPPGHYTLNGSYLADVRLDSRTPWIFSPGVMAGGPEQQLPHGGGYNVLYMQGDRRQSVQWRSADD
jgi:type II secretory pathway pseudopilin PulG